MCIRDSGKGERLFKSIGGGQPHVMDSFCDSDWAGSLYRRSSTNLIIFLDGVAVLPYGRSNCLAILSRKTISPYIWSKGTTFWTQVCWCWKAETYRCNIVLAARCMDVKSSCLFAHFNNSQFVRPEYKEVASGEAEIFSFNFGSSTTA